MVRIVVMMITRDDVLSGEEEKIREMYLHTALLFLNTLRTACLLPFACHRLSAACRRASATLKGQEKKHRRYLHGTQSSVHRLLCHPHSLRQDPYSVCSVYSFIVSPQYGCGIL